MKSYEIFDYTHLYITCEFCYKWEDKWYKDVVLTVTDCGGFCGFTNCEMFLFPDDCEKNNVEVYLILREPEKLNAEIKKEYYKRRKKVAGGTINVDTPESLKYAFSRGVDMFDLIKKGIAISEEKAATMTFEKEK